MKCIADAWDRYERELRTFLRHAAQDEADAEDLLHELFLRALRQRDGLCGIANPRAWLYRTARNLMIDRARLVKEQVPLPDDLPAPSEVPSPVDGLSQCLPRALAELSAQDREVITLCDIEGMTQHEYARRAGVSLPAAKARVQRGRIRLKAHLTEFCQVSFDETGQVAGFVPRVPL